MRLNPFQWTIYKEVINCASLSSLDLPVIRPVRYIGDLVSGLSMFYFVKRLSAFRIVAKPFADFRCYHVSFFSIRSVRM